MQPEQDLIFLHSTNITKRFFMMTLWKIASIKQIMLFLDKLETIINPSGADNDDKHVFVFHEGFLVVLTWEMIEKANISLWFFLKTNSAWQVWWYQELSSNLLTHTCITQRWWVDTPHINFLWIWIETLLVKWAPVWFRLLWTSEG